MPAVIEEPTVKAAHAPCADVALKEKAAEFVQRATKVATRATRTLNRQVPEVRRAMRRGLVRYGELKADARREVQAHPVRTVGLAIAAGAAIGWMIAAMRATPQRVEESE